MFCWSLFVLLYFFLWPLCCLLFFDYNYPFGTFKLFLLKKKHVVRTNFITLFDINVFITFATPFVYFYIRCNLMVFHPHSLWYTLASLWKINIQIDYQHNYIVSTAYWHLILCIITFCVCRCSCRLTVAWRVSLVEQELLAPPDYMRLLLVPEGFVLLDL